MTLTFPKVKNGTLIERLIRRANETEDLGDRRLMLDAVKRIEELTPKPKPVAPKKKLWKKDGRLRRHGHVSPLTR